MRRIVPIVIVVLSLAIVLWQVEGGDVDPVAVKEEPAATQPPAASERVRRPRARQPPTVAEREPLPAEEVPTAEAPEVLERPDPAPRTLAATIERLRRHAQMPGFAFTGFVTYAEGLSDWLSVGEFPAQDHPATQRSVALTTALATEVEKPFSVRRLHLAEGVAPEGKLTLAGQTFVFVSGDLEGEFHMSGQQYVYVDGDVIGTIRGSGQSLIWVRGVVRGTIDHTGQVSLVLEGGVTGTVKAKNLIGGAFGGELTGTFTWPDYAWTVYVDGHRTESEIAALPFPRTPTLHVRSSTLAPGTHPDIGEWPKVIVGHATWQHLPR